MPIKLLWRTAVFLATLLLLYLAFPVLIVPSSLPAIQAIIIDQTKPPTKPNPAQIQDPDAIPIQQLEIPTRLTINQQLQELKKLHQQGMDLIRNSF